MASRMTAWVHSPPAASAPFTNVFAALAALCHAFAGQARQARPLLRDLAGVLAKLAPHDHAVPGSIWFGVAAAWELGDAEAASWFAPLLERYRADGAPPGPMGSLDQACGRVAVLTGDDATAATGHFAAARQASAAAGDHAVRALADFDEADGAGDGAGLAACVREFERFGMHGWARRARARAAGGTPAGPSEGQRRGDHFPSAPGVPAGSATGFLRDPRSRSRRSGIWEVRDAQIPGSPENEVPGSPSGSPESEVPGSPSGAASAAGAAAAASSMGLTRRETEVLRLVAAGRTSREIADELVISLLTVNRHIANVYTKIGTRNRAEATAFAIRSGITRPPTDHTLGS